MENLPANVPHTLFPDLIGAFVPLDLPQNPVIELVISIDEEDISVSEFASYLALVDRVYGRTMPEGLMSYSHRKWGRLEIDECRAGSLELIIRVVYEHYQITALAILLLFLRSLPNLFKLTSEGVKNLADSFKAYEEGMQIRENREESRLERENRKRIREAIENEPALEKLPEPRKGQLTTLLDALAKEENTYLPAPIRFARRQVKSVILRIKGQSPPS